MFIELTLQLIVLCVPNYAWDTKSFTIPHNYTSNSSVEIYTFTMSQESPNQISVQIVEFDRSSFTGVADLFFFDGLDCTSKNFGFANQFINDLFNTSQANIRVTALFRGTGITPIVTVRFTKLTGSPKTPPYLIQSVEHFDIWGGSRTKSYYSDKQPAQRHSYFSVYRINNHAFPRTNLKTFMYLTEPKLAITILYEGHCERRMFSRHKDPKPNSFPLLQQLPQVSTAIFYVQDYSIYKHFAIIHDEQTWTIDTYTFPRNETLDNITKIYTHTRQEATGFLTRLSIQTFDTGSFEGKIRVIIFDGVKCNSEILAIFSEMTDNTVDTKSRDVRVDLILTGTGMVPNITLGFMQITGEPSTPNYVPQFGGTLDITEIPFSYTQTYVSSVRTEPEYSVFVIQTPELYQSIEQELYIWQNEVSIGFIRIYEGICEREIKQCDFGERCKIEQPTPQIATIELYHDDPTVERNFTFSVRESITTTTLESTTTSTITTAPKTTTPTTTTVHTTTTTPKTGTPTTTTVHTTTTTPKTETPTTITVPTTTRVFSTSPTNTKTNTRITSSTIETATETNGSTTPVSTEARITTHTDSLTTISRSSSGMDQEEIIWMSIVAVLVTLGR